MTGVFVVSDNIYSPLGATTAENFSQLAAGVSGVRRHEDPAMSEQPFYAALFAKGHFEQQDLILADAGKNIYSRFELLLIASISQALSASGIDATGKGTVFILSTTKGNIDLLETDAGNPELPGRVSLYGSAKKIGDHFGFVNRPVVVSNACISGIMAVLTAQRLIQSGQYENAVVAGADLIPRFILSGFQAFQAVSPGHCKPFDRARDGINLGEGAATVVLSSNGKYKDRIRIMGGSVSNDANHLSAPSRTGEELCQAIGKTLNQAGLSPEDIDLISAHGTATVYNDEMEAKAIGLAGLSAVPLNSLKGYFGHTLGAAGLIESVVSMQSLREGLALPTHGFGEIGVTRPLNICTRLMQMPMKICLKTASGFGGCNAALALGKS